MPMSLLVLRHSQSRCRPQRPSRSAPPGCTLSATLPVCDLYDFNTFIQYFYTDVKGLPRGGWARLVCFGSGTRSMTRLPAGFRPHQHALGAAALLHRAVGRPDGHRLRADLAPAAGQLQSQRPAGLLPGHHQPLRPAAIHCHPQPGCPVPGDVPGDGQPGGQRQHSPTDWLRGGNGMAVALTPTVYGKLGWDALAVLWERWLR